jgi:hypothetical protein
LPYAVSHAEHIGNFFFGSERIIDIILPIIRSHSQYKNTQVGEKKIKKVNMSTVIGKYHNKFMDYIKGAVALELGKQAYKGSKKLLTIGYRKATGAKAYKMRGGQSGYLAGKYGPRKFKKPKGKYYKKTSRVSARDGYAGCTETSGGFNDRNCVTIGHITHPIYELGVSIICNLYAQLFNRIHRPVLRWSDLHGFDPTWGMSIVFTDDTSTERAFQVYFVASETHRQACVRILNQLITNLLLYPCNAGSMNVFQFFTSAGTVYEGAMLLRGATVTSVGKSSLKIQNRSVAAVGDDEDDVDNQPLTGRIYERYGGHIRFNDRQASVQGNSSTGRMLETASTFTYLQEPVDNWMVSGKGGFKSIRVDPGKIKTSVLTYTLKISLDKFVSELNKVAQSYGTLFGNQKCGHNLGKARMMQLERVIDAGEVDINGAYEIDTKLYTKVNCKKYRINRFFQKI